MNRSTNRAKDYDLASVGFTLLELLVVVAIIAILAGLILPAISRGKHSSRRAQCQNNVKQLMVAVHLYSGDSSGVFPPRSSPGWDSYLVPYYQADGLLLCPTGPESEYRSYLMNGFNDFFSSTLAGEEFILFLNHQWPKGMPESAITEPSETILFGEKRINSQEVHMDTSQNNHLTALDHLRHKESANYGFGDGGVRTLGFGKCLEPVNLWGTTPQGRVAVFLQP